MAEFADGTRRPVLGKGLPLRVAAASITVLAVMAVDLNAVLPAAARIAQQPLATTVLSALCLCVAGMSVGILGSRGMMSPRRAVRTAWKVAALVVPAATCIWATPNVAARGVPGTVLTTVLWAGTGVATLIVLGSLAYPSSRVVRTWALAAPFLLLAFWGFLAAGVTGSFDVAASVLVTPVAVVAVGAVALVPGLTVRESMESLRGEGLTNRPLAGPRAGRVVWVVTGVKTLVTLSTILVGCWRWKLVPDVRSWISATGAVLLLVAVLAFDHRLPVFLRNHPRVATRAGLLISLPLLVVVGMRMLLTTAALPPGPLVALAVLIVVVGALEWTWARRHRWRVAWQ
jgi:hypothetical protein